MTITLLSIICTIISPAWALVGGITHSPPIVPEISIGHLSKVSQLVSSALGDVVVIDDDTGNEDASSGRYALADTGGSKDSSSSRYTLARDAVSNFQRDNDDNESPSSIPQNELVYGELSVPTLATILDAVGVHDDDVFLDIGSGDGALVLGASLLYASNDSSSDGDIDEEKSGGERRRRNAIQKCYGVDIVPGLVERSLVHAKNLERILQDDESSNDLILKNNQSEIHFLLGDIHTPDKQLQGILQETTLAVCFATTWSAGNANNDSSDDKRRSTSLQGRRLPKLSSALSTSLSSGCRVVVIDGKLSEEDGFIWQGDLKIICPDTAPHSIATLYHKQ